MEKELIKKGWYLTPEGLEECSENGEKSANSAIKKALNLDLKTFGKKWLPTDVSTGRIKVDFLEGPGVLQITKLRNVSAPKDNEESQAAPRLWKITLTDGHATVAAVCLQPLKNLSLKTPPGTKLLLEGKAQILSGYLLLSNKNCQLLGGHVSKLVEAWQLKLKLAQQSRVGIQSEGGPPPFVPLGKKMSSARIEAPQKDDFKSLGASTQAGETEEENSEFQQQRQATIAEAEALTSKPKTFGGGQKSSLKDSDVARIVEMGFTADQAGSALRQSGGDLTEAIGKLLGGHVDGWGEGFGQGRGGRGGGRGGGIRERGGEQGQEEGERGARRGGRRDGRRRGRRGEEEEEEEGEGGVSGRPSGPSTLFDFLETKIPAKSDKESAGKQRPVSGQEPRYHGDQRTDHRPHTASGDGRSSPRPSYPRLDREQDFAKPSKQEREAKAPQGGWSQASEKEPKWSGRGQRNAQNDIEKESQPAHASSSNKNDRGKRSRDNRTSQNNENHPRQTPPQSAQNVNRSDRSGMSKSDQSSQPDKQRRNQNSDSRQNRRDFQQSPRPDQTHSKPFREQHANVDDHSSEDPVDRHHPQSGSNRADRRAANQRGQPEYGQKASSRPRLRRGEVVLAKYWEDNQLYPAVVEVVAENWHTAVVTFLDYGNQEEVLCADLHPMQTHAHQGSSGAPANTQGRFPDSRQFSEPNPHGPVSNAEFESDVIPQMEFRRGGSWQGHRQQGQDNRRRPTQNYYTPPSYKK